MIKVSPAMGGHRNVIFDVRGRTGEKDAHSLEALATGGTTLKLGGIVWVVQEKMGVNLWWDKGEDLLFAMESRNAMRLEPCIRPPESWDGTLYFSTYNQPRPFSTFYVRLDFDR